MPQKMPQEKLYVHLDCEGWVTFGPYKWIAWQNDGRTLVDNCGDTIAHQTEGGWWCRPGDKYQNFHFRTPLITVGSQHPYPLMGQLQFDQGGK
jgi:hypothetical protein